RARGAGNDGPSPVEALPDSLSVGVVVIGVELVPAIYLAGGSLSKTGNGD
ncbi:MAG: hypothetical protein UW69_C0099G0001, partial [Microgenomates group bacterium GW2011_GWA2_44_7]